MKFLYFILTLSVAPEFAVLIDATSTNICNDIIGHWTRYISSENKKKLLKMFLQIYHIPPKEKESVSIFFLDLVHIDIGEEM